MSNLKSWVALNSAGLVVHGFDASEEFISNFEDRIINRDDIPNPLWWVEDNIVFENVDDVNPRPIVSFYKEASGAWVDGRPILTTNKNVIPPDGITQATVTFTQTGPATPLSITFDVNGSEVSETLSPEGTATCEVVSSNPGDVIVVSANGASVTITVEG